VNEYADSDGCPDEDQVRVVGDKIVLDDRVHFMVNSHIIRRVSYGLLERLGKLIADHPEYVHIEIEGHADERGTDAYNQQLSERRAVSVLEFLVKSGIPRQRLSAKGYGETAPRSDRKTEFGFYQNRRVEFIITRETNVVPRQAPPPNTQPPALDHDGPPPADTAAPPDTAAPSETPPKEGGPVPKVPAPKTPTPKEPAPTPKEPAPTPKEPAPTPKEPAPTPKEPAPKPKEPAPPAPRGSKGGQP
jgi:hypothetical protein